MSTNSKPPKVFISYSWSPEEHAQMALDLATRLVKDGIEVVFDKWDLRIGNDTIAFMERMVHDSTIDYVLLMCSKAYTDKANGREGGVGIEGSIVSSEVYGQIGQTKFVPIVIEVDKEGKPYKPTYLKPTFHIDLSDVDNYEDHYIALVRHIFGEPLYVKPILGTKPPYLQSDSGLKLTCAGKLKAFKNSIHKQDPLFKRMLRDFTAALLVDMEKLIILKSDIDGLPHNQKIEQITVKVHASGELTPIFEELTEIFACSYEYISELEIVGFIEKMLDLRARIESESTRNGLDHRRYIDPIAVVQYEFFLLLINSLFKYSLYSEVSRLTTKIYQVYPYPKYHIDAIAGSNLTFTGFNHAPTVFEENGEWKQNYRIHYKDFVEKRLRENTIQNVQETDFILSIISIKLTGDYWNAFLCHKTPTNIDLLRRMQSTEMFNRIVPIFAVKSVREMQDLLERYTREVLYRSSDHSNLDIYPLCQNP